MEWCCTGTGEHFHQQWQWLFLADASVCEQYEDSEEPWLLAVKYTFNGEALSTTMQCHSGMHRSAVAS